MAQTTRQAFANVASGVTDQILVSADSSTTQRSIKVVALAFVAGPTATSATFNSLPSGGSGTAISPLFQNGANGGAILNRNEDGWFSTSPIQALSITTLSGGTTLGVLVNYVYV